MISLSSVRCEKQLLFPAAMTWITSPFYFLRNDIADTLRYWINSMENRVEFPYFLARPRETSIFHAFPEFTRLSTCRVAFACANWQVVTVIHKWAGSRPREQGHHSILRSRRGHLIVIIVMPDGCTASPFTRVSSPPGSHAPRTYTQKRELFPRVRAPPARVPIIFTSGGTSAEVFHLRTYHRTGYLARDKW